MAQLTVYERQVDPVFTPADAGGDAFVNSGATELLILNVGQSTVDVTATATRKCSHGFYEDWTTTVNPGVLMRFGPFVGSRFNDSQNNVSVSYEDETYITVAAQKQQ